MLLSVIGVLLAASVARPSVADTAPPPGAHSPMNPQQMLQLTPEQSKRFAQFETASREKKHKLIDQLHDIRHQLWVVYQSYDLDVRKAKGLNRDLNRVQQELLNLHLEEQVQLRKILTTEQFNKLQACLRQHEASRNSTHHDDHGNSEWSH
jgi:Spy/CpxP family protein refolding chaperone